MGIEEPMTTVLEVAELLAAQSTDVIKPETRWYRAQCLLCRYPDGLASARHHPDCLFWTAPAASEPTEWTPPDAIVIDMEHVNLLWEPMRCMPEDNGWGLKCEDGTVIILAGFAYFDESVWEQRDGQFSVPYRR